MEDILASIRKIIADDDALPLSRRGTPAAPPAAAAPEPFAPEPFKPAPEPLKPEPVASAPAPIPPLPAAAPVVPPPPAPLKPPPLPRLSGFVKRLGGSMAPAAPEPVAASPESVAPELRPSLDAAPVGSSEGETIALDVEQEPVAPPVAADEPFAPAQPKPAVSFESVGFKVPPLSFRANVPPPPAPPVAPTVQVSAAPVAPVPEPAPAAEAAQASPAPVAVPTAIVEPARRPPILPPARLDRIEPSLLSENSGIKVGAAFEALAESALLRDPEMVERLTREILRPIIKSWLDDNLPNVVERLVRAEIERVARGPQG